MTTFAQARDAVVEDVATLWPAAYPTVPLFFDNGPAADLDKIDEFLACQIAFSTSAQREIGPAPAMRTYGSVTFVLGVKAMKGYKVSLGRADYLSNLYRFSVNQGVIFGSPHLLPPSEKKGWFLTELVVPFYFDG